MPTLWIATNILLPIVIGLISNYAWDKIRNHGDKDAKVNVTIIYNKDNKIKSIHYSGPATKFKDVMNKYIKKASK